MRRSKQDRLYIEARYAMFDGDYRYALRILRKLARHKYAKALNDLGTIYATPLFVTQDLKTAQKYYLMAEKFDDGIAAYNLSLLYLNNDEKHGIKKDLSLSRHYAEKAYRKGISYAIYGTLTESPRESSLETLRECMEYVPDAKYHYAMAILSSDPNQAISLLESAANEGHILACYEIARRYELGIDRFAKNTGEAMRLYSKICTSYPPAAYRLAELLKEKNEDKRTMLACYERSADVKYGFAPGMVAYAEILQNGLYGVTRSPARAQKYIDAVLECNDAKAAFTLSDKIKNIEKKERLIRQAAEEGYLPAVIAYAKLLDKRGKEQSSPYFLKAAYLGDADSQYEIAKRYLDGIGIEKNRNACLFFLEKAVASHHHGAMAMLGKLLIKDKDPDSRERGYKFLNQERDNDPECYYYLGKRYLELFEETNRASYIGKAKESFFRAIDGKVPAAFYELGKLYVEGKYLARDVKLGIKYLKEGEKAGFIDANCLLAEILFDIGQLSNAKSYITPALNAGYPEAEYVYGKLLLAEGNDRGKSYIESAAKKGVEKAKNDYLGFGQDEEFIMSIVEELAQKGNIEAIRRYISILKTKTSEEAKFELVHYLTILSNNGEQEATLLLAEMYEQGEGVAANPFKAKELLERVQSQKGYLKLAAYYEFGTATEPDLEKAVSLYEKAADEGSIDAVRLCVNFALEGYDLIPPDKQKAIKYLQILEENGDVNAIFTLYKLLKNSDSEAAISKLAKASDADLPDARIIYASYLLKKNENIDIAFTYIKEGVTRKQPEAYYLLGYCHEMGIGTSADYRKAFDNYLKGAQKGNLEAIKKVCYCYSYGIGVTVDEEKAAAWKLRGSLSNQVSELYI